MEIQYFNLDKLKRAKLAVAIEKGLVKADDLESIKIKAAVEIPDDTEEVLRQYLKLRGHVTKDGVKIPHEEADSEKPIIGTAKPRITKSAKVPGYKKKK